ncbi:YcxB family protein [Paracoccus aurantiacus]|uniref:YcxB family protein n=1 Tax=Paracoccus aurantiacus TaxID=2599412 RepID=A0A5C6S7C4_9RHOB|nr:YcxB family protein [Paracoccus aurantiacus]TXB69951.1 YcxB family protein [Paracoccus aurantiacus]
MQPTDLVRSAVIELTPRDFRLAHRLRALSGYRRGKTLIRLLLVWLFAIAVFGVSDYLDGARGARLLNGLLHAAAIYGLLMVGVLLLMSFVLTPLVIRRRFRQDKLVGLPAQVSWNEKRYKVVAPNAQSDVQWTDYNKILSDRHSFLFFVSDYSFQILPTRFLTEAQIADIDRITARFRD